MSALETIPFTQLNLKHIRATDYAEIVEGFSQLCSKSGLDPAPDLWCTDSADNLEAISFQDRYPPAIVVTNALLNAFKEHPQEFVTGILSHEIGHIMNTQKEIDIDARVKRFHRLFPGMGAVLGGFGFSGSMALSDDQGSMSRRGFFQNLVGGALTGTAAGAAAAVFHENQKKLEKELAADLTGITLHQNPAAHIACSDRLIRLAEARGEDATRLKQVTQIVKAIVHKPKKQAAHESP